jgi:hypothetical protein
MAIDTTTSACCGVCGTEMEASDVAGRYVCPREADPDHCEPPVAPTPPPATPRRGTIRAAWKDLNARGKGDKCYRLAVDGEALVWIDQHPACVGDGRKLSRDDLRASGRHDETSVEVPEGLVVLTISKSVPSGDVSYDLRRTKWNEEKGRMGLYSDGLRHVGVRRQAGSFVHVVEIDGVRKELAS